ncbi:MAG: UDP-N-acetylmuramoyl-tripeptide--D-alanyl-D-alanine ligase [Actinobacteria bacterium]|nr:UDP-N-acetylmuramoyl-tripeptide--D-alanyl-D-alanine ligase [Actinomycetota bacterium]
MITLRLADVATATGGRLADLSSGDRTVHEVTTDSRDVPDRALFVALRGERHDGHDHIAEAIDAGAVAYVAERPTSTAAPAVLVDDTRRALRDLARVVRERVAPQVVAITGSVGKTTTKDLAAAALGAGRRTVAAPGSYNNEIGVPLTCLAARADTEVLVVEVGSRGVGHIAALMAVVQPDVAIVTAVNAAHLEMFGDVDTVARAKGELVEALSPAGTAILNADDARVLAMAARTDAQVLTYGRTDADVVADDVDLDRLARPRFLARTPWGEAHVSVPLAGEHHVSNSLAALAAAGIAGVDIEAAAAALRAAPVSSWRSEVSEAGGVVVLNDAYNANPASMRAALDALLRIQGTVAGRSWAVLGLMAEMGETSHDDHRALGRECAAAGLDRLVVVGRGDAAAIAAGAREAGFAGDHLWQVDDADGAVDVVHPRVRAGDVVLVKASRVGGLEAVADALLNRSGAAP